MKAGRFHLIWGALILALLAVVVLPFGLHPKPAVATRPVNESINVAFANRQATASLPSPPAAPRSLPGGAAPIKGYASEVSVQRGQSLHFAVSTFSPAYDVYIQRFGYFAGDYVRTVWAQRGLPGRQQGYWLPKTFGVQKCPTCTVSSRTGEISANWHWSFTLDVPATWPSGLYRAVLVSPAGEDVVPFVVRADDESQPVLVDISFNTYQAYNRWGGKSLYAYNSYGPRTMTGTPRAVMVSFDRPYASWEQTTFPVIGYGTASDWMLAVWLSRLGEPADFVTDVDLARDPFLTLGHRLILFPGHQEYWSQAERTAVEAARDQGVNLAFLGGNDVYWRVRYQDAYRTLVEYRVPALDPLRRDAAAVTGLFASPAVGEPQSTLLGTLYQSGVPGWLDWEVGPAAPSWLLAGTKLDAGDTVSQAVGGECDVLRPAAPHPSGEIVVGRAFFRGVGIAECDSTLYQARSGAWVFNAGDMDWEIRLLGTTPTNRAVSRITENLVLKLAG